MSKSPPPPSRAKARRCAAITGLGARAKTGHPLALVGLADDYVGYVEEPAPTEQGEGEAMRSYHGPGLAEALGL